MATHTPRRFCAVTLATIASTFVAVSSAAVPVHIVKTDLKPGIRAGMQSPVQFAVLVPHAVSTAGGGSWSTAGERATWHYAVQVPTAVSLSFHATHSALPDSAVLVVRGAKTTTSYRARDLHNGDLWSRIQPGEALEFTLTVSTAERSKVGFNIISLQAGYRSLGAGVKDHPYYRQLRAQMAPSGNAACVTNYECEVTVANTPPAAATVGLVIGNQYQCTGALINDVSGDNTPYLLTARHCETGTLGGGNPGAASTVTVYWDATTPCGTSLGSLYDPGIPTQTGAQTIVEQQDVWLIQLDASPVASDAQFSGFDASGSTVRGGYTIHHAEGYNKQFVGWFGQAAAVQDNGVLGTNYLSNFWETVNQVGNIGPGASGGGLFDQNNHLVGSLTLGRSTSDASGYGACPVTPPPAPNGSNGVADFTSLAAIWDSTADATSSTGSVTLKSVLDPGNTGKLVVASAPVIVISFGASPQSLSIGAQTTLSWSASGAAQCTAGDGVAGDGWSGTLAASGTKSVTESAANLVTYTLICVYAGGRSAKASVTVSWLGPTPILQFNAPSTVWTAAPATLSWTSNVTPCAITGGGLSLANLASSGTTTTTQATAGDVGYTLTCGPPNQSDSYSVTVSYITPSLVFNANGTDRRMGETFFLLWSTAATSCTPSGGAPNDGWANTQYTGFYAQNEQVNPTVTTPGTYTYTLTCSAGPNKVQQSVTVTFENSAPYVSLSLNPSSVTFSHSPADYATLTWKTNLSSCAFNSSTDIEITGYLPGVWAQGVNTLAPSQSGTYPVTATCYAAGPNPLSAMSAVTLTVLPPPAPVLSISFSPSTVVAGESFTASWTSTNTWDCEQTGGIPGGPWGSSSGFTFDPSGSVAAESGAAGQYTFGVTCQSIDPNTANASTQASLTIGPLTATLTPSTTSVTSGSSFTLAWSSVGATGCAASGGGASGTPWAGSVATSGTLSQTATATGAFTYTLVCSAGSASTAPQQATVNVTAASSNGGGGSGGGSGGSGGGHGGGGAIGLLELALLAGMRGLRRRARSA